jgi:hypothetical protein
MIDKGEPHGDWAHAVVRKETTLKVLLDGADVKSYTCYDCCV